MAARNGLFNNLWLKVKQDSASWGSLLLLFCGIAAVVTILSWFAYS
ncbi:MAG: hypothetical protein VKL59_12590 [Nostocaceae cyanobacterium]|nr:hypothetical protein [Nostocaceae cyanobacterium]